MQKAKGHLFPFGWIYLLKGFEEQAESDRPLPDGGLAGISEQRRERIAVQRLIPVYKSVGAIYAESNPELETNNAVQAQWDYFKREHHKTRRAYIKQLKGKS